MNFCDLCTPVATIPGVHVQQACFVRARNFSKLCTPVPHYMEILDVLQDFHTRTWNVLRLSKGPPTLTQLVRFL